MNISTTIKKADITSLAIGCFDGFHLGHLEIFKHLDENGGILIIDKKKSFCLLPNERKKEFTNLTIFFVNFSKIKDLEGVIFLDLLKKEFPNLKKIVVGEDFKFGKDRKYEAKDIEKLANLPCEIVKEFKINGFGVHSRFIKEFLSLAELKKASQFLGRIYSIKGCIIKGQGLGKKKLVPTLNLDIKEKYFLPKNGVYASFCKIRKKIYKSVSFIGVRNTDQNFSIETHILEDFKELDAKNAEIFFICFLRENKKFVDLKALKEQISKDIKNALKCLEKESL